MVTQELRDKFDIPQHANLFALIYRAAVELYGEKGAQAADEGTKHYGNQRGARMAMRAKIDGAPLTMRSYLLYGEWADKNHRSQGYDSAYEPVYCKATTVCGWCESWKDAGLLEYGKNYCTYVDKNLVKGFNPRLSININSVLSQGGETCAFEWLGYAMDSEEEKKNFASEKMALVKAGTMKDFLFHTAHLLVAMTEAIAMELGTFKAEKVKEKALADFAHIYGAEQVEAILSEAQQDFTTVDYRGVKA